MMATPGGRRGLSALSVMKTFWFHVEKNGFKLQVLGGGSGNNTNMGWGWGTREREGRRETERVFIHIGLSVSFT